MRAITGVPIIMAYLLISWPHQALVGGCTAGVRRSGGRSAQRTEQITTTSDLSSALGGDSRLDGPIANGNDRGAISRGEDLNCADFTNCRWRNEKGSEGAEDVDEMDFVQGSGTPDPSRSRLIFGTATTPEGKWAAAGTRNRKTGDKSAIFVSDPIQCQDQAGRLDFEYWTSPRTLVEVCTRDPGGGKNFILCAPPISDGDPGPVTVEIPPNLDPFEIVISARQFDFQGAGQSGGIVILDNIFYDGTLCEKEAESTDTDTETEEEEDEVDPAPPSLPRRNTPSPTESETETDFETNTDVGESDFSLQEACQAIQCTGDQGSCMDKVGENGWDVSTSRSVGNRHTGIRRRLEGDFLFAQGPRGTAIFRSDPFTIQSRSAILRFCYYRASANTLMKVVGTPNGRREEIFKSPPINTDPHSWRCEDRRLAPGTYQSGLEFIAEGLRNEHSYFGLDSIDLLDSSRGGQPTSPC